MSWWEVPVEITNRGIAIVEADNKGDAWEKASKSEWDDVVGEEMVDFNPYGKPKEAK